MIRRTNRIMSATAKLGARMKNTKTNSVPGCKG